MPGKEDSGGLVSASLCRAVAVTAAAPSSCSLIICPSVTAVSPEHETVPGARYVVERGHKNLTGNGIFAGLTFFFGDFFFFFQFGEQSANWFS